MDSDIPSLKSIYVDYFASEFREGVTDRAAAIAYLRDATALCPPPPDVANTLADCLLDPSKLEHVFDNMFENLFTRQAWLKALDDTVEHASANARFQQACDVIMKDSRLSAKDLEFIEKARQDMGSAVSGLDVEQLLRLLSLAKDAPKN